MVEKKAKKIMAGVAGSQHGPASDAADASAAKVPVSGVAGRRAKPSMQKLKPESGKAGTAERYFAILEHVAQAVVPVSVRDLMEHFELSKATAHRLVRRFKLHGLLTQEFGSKRLVIGPRLTALALDVLRASMQQLPRRAILQNLAQEVGGETCNIGTLDGTEVVYLDRVESDHWPLLLKFRVGSRVPVHCTAIGKLFLAFLPPRQRHQLLSNLALRRYTDHTVTDRESLEKELERIRADKYAMDNQEFLAGVVCVAVPIWDARGEIRAAVAVQAPDARMSLEDARCLFPVLQVAASRLTASLDSEFDSRANSEPSDATR